MATNARDVSLTIKANTSGEGEIKALATQVRALGKAGTDAAPEFERLATELDTLAGQARTVDNFKALTAEVDAAGAALRNSATIAEGAGAAYRQQAAATNELRDAQRKAADEVVRVKGAQDDARDALRRQRLEASAATKDTDEYAASVKRAKLNILDLGTELRAKRKDLSEATAATREAAKEESTLADAHQRAAKSLAENQAAESKRSSALREAAEAARLAGVNVADLTGEESRLASTLTTVVAAAEKNRVGMLEAADAAEKLAQATAQAERSEQALAEIRKVAYQQNNAAKIKAEAEAARDLAQAQAQAEKSEQALAEIRRLAYQQDAAAKIKAEAEAQALLNTEQAQAERIQTALANIRRIAYQQNTAAQIKAEADALQQLAAAAQQAADALPKAFGQAGVRSVALIQAEISQTGRALTYLEAQFKAGAISAYDLQRATGSAAARMQQLREEMQQLPAATGLLERMNASVLSLVNRFGALSAAVATVGFAVKPILDANIALDSMRRVLTTVYGSAAEAGKQIDFVRRVSEAAGLNVTTTGEAFTKFAASAKSAGVSTDLVQRVFESTANAAGNLGLSSDKVGNILNALSQMANKGTVSMEELRGQLGESLPGALSLLAKGLGITEPQLVKLVESGKLLTSEALGPLAKAMDTLAAPGGRVEGLRASMERLGNKFVEAYRQIGDSGAVKALGAVLDGLASNFGVVSKAAVVMFEALAISKLLALASNFLGLKAATDAAAAAALRSAEASTAEAAASTRASVAATEKAVATRAAAVASDIAAAAAVRNAAAQTAATAGMTTGVTAAAVAANTLTVAKGALATAGARVLAVMGGLPGLLLAAGLAMIQFGPAILKAAAGMLGFGDAAKQAAAYTKYQAEQTALAAKEHGAAEASLVQAKVRYGELAHSLNEATVNAEKHVKAVKDVGDASVAVADLTGRESDKLQATAKARADNVVALEAEAKARKAEAVATEGLVTRMEREIAVKGSLLASDQAQLDSLREKLDLVGRLAPGEQALLKVLEDKEDQAKKSTVADLEALKVTREKLAAQQAASEQTAAATVKERALAEASNFAAEAARNNTARIKELKDAWTASEKELARLTQGQRDGWVTQEQVTVATTRAAQAQGLYRGALEQSLKVGVDLRELQTGISDDYFKQVGAINGVITTLKALGVSAEKASPQLSAALDKQIEAAKTKEELEFLKAEVLRARDAFLLLGPDAERELLRIKSRVIELSPAMSQAAKDARLLGVELKDKIGGGADAGVKASLEAYERLKVGGQATEREVGQAFVNLATKAIDANRGIVPEWVKVEAAIRGATIQIDENGKATVQAADLTLKNTKQMAAGFDHVADSAQKATDAALRYGSALKSTQYDAEKFTLGADGQRLTASNGTADPLAARQQANSAQATFDAALSAYLLASDKVQNYSKYFSTTGVSAATTGARQSALQEELTRALAALQTAQASLTPVPGVKSPVATEPSAAPAASSTRTVNINLTGMGSTSINVASDADAARLEAMLQQLAAASARSGG